MKYPLKQVMGMMPEINPKSNDRSSFLWEELHSDRMAQQNTCALASTQYGFPRQLAHRRNPGGDIHDAPRGVTFTQRLACARVFQFSACVRIYNVCITCVDYYNYLYTMPFFVFFIIIIFPWIRTFWTPFRIFVFPSDFRNKYEFFVTVGSSVCRIGPMGCWGKQ